MAHEKKNRTLDDYIEAGAWYRIWKEISCKSDIVLENLFGFKNGKIKTAYDKVLNLEYDCNFEEELFSDFPNIKGGNSIFYGGLEINKTSETAEEVSNKIIEVLEDLLKKIKEDNK